MIIEHSESRQYIDQTYKDRGKVSVFRIDIDIKDLRSAWTPVKDEAIAYQVFSDRGEELFLYTDEFDNYARMFAVPRDKVISREHQKDIVNPENLPGVGHFYRVERERKQLEEEMQVHNEAKLSDLIKSFNVYHGMIWDQMNSVNRRYGNIYDTGEGKDSYIASKDKPTLYSTPPPPDGYVLSVIKMLDRFERKTGTPFTPSLDDDAETKDRLKALTQQLSEAVFIAEQGYFPEIKQEYDGVADTEVVLSYLLKDKHNNPIATIKALFQESEAFYGCVEAPIVMSVDYHDINESYDFDDDSEYDELARAFNDFLYKAYGDEQWVIEPDHVGPRRMMNSLDESELMEVTRFIDLDEGRKFNWIKRSLEEYSEIGDLVRERVKELGHEVHSSPSP